MIHRSDGCAVSPDRIMSIHKMDKCPRIHGVMEVTHWARIDQHKYTNIYAETLLMTSYGVCGVAKMVATCTQYHNGVLTVAARQFHCWDGLAVFRAV
ncbi:hypothetical protein RRG08_059160 [Elysia crispata]|uniref:Uncharacterized protein n=1 Tax=Elysia crispata TaxID=231223 RepID=A0AAE1B2N2_9GAST|nr:hypothetical protein RRG08_059160 [Elysia crispata]